MWQKYWICIIQLSVRSCRISFSISRTILNLSRNWFQILSTLGTCSHQNYLSTLRLIYNWLGIATGQTKPIFFQWFYEYSQIPIFETRKSALNPIGSIVFNKFDGAMHVFCIILGRYFFEKISPRDPVTCPITGNWYASLLENIFIWIWKCVSAFHVEFFHKM